MAGIGPVPLAGLMLSEMGARVLRVERVAGGPPLIDIPAEYDLDRHGRDIVEIDLKQAEGREVLLRLAGKADILIEGYRPGVMERLGAGPEAVQSRNPGLVYGRMTGFGQDGPLASRAGHDLTYLAYSGVLHAIGRTDENPVPPLNLVGDYGGGTMFLLCGILAALVERGRTGQGRVVDA
ncbi:MAG: CoA transferase, partial [Candidatus Competibacteraceae bacterium]|nr:CoA transferase [Candidatus Competibacteraceae bacterium]